MSLPASPNRDAVIAIQGGGVFDAGAAYHSLSTGLDCPILGVVCVDAGWSYPELGFDPDPNVHYKDVRIQAVLSLMQASALTVGKALVEHFPSVGETV